MSSFKNNKAVEDCPGFHLGRQPPHFCIVKIYSANNSTIISASEIGELFSNGQTGPAADNAGDGRLGKLWQPACRPRPPRETSNIDPILVDSKPGMGISPDRVDGMEDGFPGAVLGIIGPGHDISVSLRDRPVSLHGNSPLSAGVESIKDRPFLLRRISGGKIKSVTLGRIVLTNDFLADLPSSYLVLAGYLKPEKKQ